MELKIEPFPLDIRAISVPKDGLFFSCEMVGGVDAPDGADAQTRRRADAQTRSSRKLGMASRGGAFITLLSSSTFLFFGSSEMETIVMGLASHRGQTQYYQGELIQIERE
jgi:hypothetical protein